MGTHKRSWFLWPNISTAAADRQTDRGDLVMETLDGVTVVEFSTYIHIDIFHFVKK